MELMSMHQQSAYDKLFRWVKDEFHSIQDDVSDIDPLVVVAVVTLKEKQPVLLNYCFDEIVATRSQMLVEAFHIALTVGGPGGMPRPIEMHAHDPLRYVGDMLAWIHQAVASEYELLNRVFGHEAKNRILSDPELRVLLDWRSRNKNDKENGEKRKSLESVNDAAQIAVGDNIKAVLSRIFEALVHPFKVRLDHILDEENQPGIVQVYRLSNVLDFYSRTIAKIIGKTSSLTDAFNYCRDETLKLFYNLIKQHSEKLMASITRPPPDLAPPHAVHEAMSRLMEIMATFDESLVPSDEREREFAPVVASVIDPLVHMCTVNATVLNAPDMAVYLINCLSVMKNTVAAYEFTSERAEALGLHIDSHMDTLVQEEMAIFLRHCNLVEKLNILQNRTSERPLSKEPSMDSRAVGTAMRSFERALFELEALIMPQCDRLVDTILRRTAKDRVGQVIVNVYETLYEAIVDPRNKYDDHPTILHYKPDQVRTMLGL
ncbi:Golgi transport complex subunit 6, variant 2 [Balamuthia mandrillaris]